MATRNKIARNRAAASAAADRALWPDPWHAFHSFPLSKRNETKRNTPIHAICLASIRFRVSIHSNRHNAFWPSPRMRNTAREMSVEGVGDRRESMAEARVRLCAAIGRRGEDARVKLVSGAKAGGWFSGLTPVYNSRTAPSGWNPPRTFHPEAIHHPLLLTPPTPRETLTRYQPSPSPPSLPCQTCRRGQFAKLITVG